MVPSWIGISYFLPVRLSVMVSVSSMSTQCLRRLQAVEAQAPGSRPRASVPDRPACIARCRTAPSPDPAACAGSTGMENQAAPCATFVLYLMGYWPLFRLRGRRIRFGEERSDLTAQLVLNDVHLP